MLLVLALAGYCALPSNPPADLFQAQWLELAGDDGGSGRRHLVAPTQVKEHRSRGALSEAGEGGAGPAVMAQAARLPERSFAAERPRHPGDHAGAARPAARWHSRAPPAA